MWQSRLVTSWVGLLSPDSSACSDCVSFWPHPLLAMSNKQLPANRRGKQTVTARVSFLTASEPSGKRDTCNNPHRVSATFTKRALPTRETTSEPPKVARTCGVLHLLTSKCASRHNGMRFFDISTSKSGPTLVCFVHVDFEMCFAPQRHALFRHLNFQKWSDIGVFCAFWLRNVLRATTVCTFSTSQLPKVVRTWCVLHILTSKCASRHNGVHFFISHLARWLRTRRFSEPTFRPSGATNHWKNTVFRGFSTSASSFWWLFLFYHLLSSALLFSLPLPSSALHLSILSEVWLLNFLRWYNLTKYNIQIYIIIYIYIFPFWTLDLGVVEFKDSRHVAAYMQLQASPENSKTPHCGPMTSTYLHCLQCSCMQPNTVG